jgi:hypothetical protein
MSVRSTNPSDQDSVHEKREFFRVNDKILLKYRSWDADLDDSDQITYADIFGSGDMTDLRSQQALDAVTSKNMQLGRYLQYINKRISDLTRYLILQELRSDPNCVSFVNIGGGGISFCSHMPISVGTNLHIDMLLVATCTGIVAQGRVVRSEKINAQIKGGSFITAVEFTTIEESDRDRLVRHILRRQAEDLKASRI